MMETILALLRQLAEATGAAGGRLAAFVRRVAKAGDLDAADEAILAALTREIDIRKRLKADYAPNFLRAENDAPAPPAVAHALAGVFLLSAVQAEARKDRARALKRLNTALKAADLGGGSGAEHAGLRTVLLAALDRMCPEFAP